MPPRGVWVPAAFFVAAGLLEMGLAVRAAATEPRFWPLWEALGRSLPYFAVAMGLWHRLALSRAVAMIYCLAALVMYLVAIGLALAGAPGRFDDALVVESLFQVPSCALLLPWLRRPQAAELFGRRLGGV
jgi:hypothetical protein